MADRVCPTVVRGDEATWHATKVAGVSVRPLRRNPETGE